MNLDYHQFGGRYAETAALRGLLAHAGIAAPHTGRPFTEELLFDIGGGIGLGYFVYESGDYTSLFVATRITTQETGTSSFLHTICERLGVPIAALTASGPGPAEKKLRQALAGGRPAAVWVDPRRLPYPGTPAGYHPLVVYGVEEETGQVAWHAADRCRVPVRLSAAELDTARQGEGAAKFRSLVVTGTGPPAELGGAVRLGIADCCRQMAEGYGPANLRGNFGLGALDKWAALLVNGRDKRGWPRFFPPGPRLYAVLLSAADQIENRSSRGAALRLMYADFLAEAAAILHQDAYLDVAGAIRESARLWNGLATALLPQSLPLLAEARHLLARRRVVFEEQGRDAPEVEQANARLAEIESQAAAESMPAGQVEALLKELHSRVQAIRQVEAGAVSALQATLT